MNRPILKIPQQGFTLIEAMIVVVILAILAAIAYPTYVEQIRKANRSVAKSALLEMANRQERYFFSARFYAGLSQLGYSNVIGTSYVEFDRSGATTSDANATIYRVTVPVASSTSYELRATPVGDQANDKCGTFVLSSNNSKQVINTTGTPANECW